MPNFLNRFTTEGSQSAATAIRTELVRLRSGRFAIPAEYCEARGISDDTLLCVVLQDGGLRIKADECAKASTGSPWLHDGMPEGGDDAKG